MPPLRWILRLLLIGAFLLELVQCRKSYYDLLGVSKTANEKDIKKAYRKLALKHHPDKGGSEEEFKELSKAYDCLSDPEKRQVYDQYGEAGLESGTNAGGFPFGAGTGAGASGGPNPFSSYFSAGSSNNRGQGFRTETFSFGGDGNGNIDISQILREMMGGNENAFFSSHHGGMPRQSQSGGPRRGHSSPPPAYSKPLKCTLEDLATGRTKKMKVQYQGKEKIFEIALKPGWKEGTKITFQATPDFPATLVFQLQETPHTYLRRQGNDLYYTCWISESQTKGGIKLKVPLPTGEVWSKHIPQQSSDQGDTTVVPHGKRMVIPSKGMPIKGGPERGDLIIEFRVRRSSSPSSSS